MPLGIRPTIDFVFNILYGSLANEDLLIHLLNAVLQPDDPIVKVTILNPFNEKEFDADKLSIVDIKAYDSRGRWFVVEVQTTLPAGLCNRLVYYTGRVYCDQMREGQSYTELQPAISICFLTEKLFPKVDAGHTRFVLYDAENKLEFGDQLQVHVVELPKYDLDEDSIGEGTDLEQLVFFMGRADQYDADAGATLARSGLSKIDRSAGDDFAKPRITGVV